MLQETQKKLYFWGLIILAALGLLFVLWAMIFNRGTLSVTAAVPFQVHIPNLLTEVCTENPCSITLAPGDYTLTLEKSGYSSQVRNVSVPIGGRVDIEAEFQFIPTIVEQGFEEELDVFGDPYTEENYNAYLELDPSTGRQTLYYEAVNGGDTSPKVATSFIRTIQDYTIIPTIEERNSIFFIDHRSGGSTLYFIDLTAKTRDALVSFPHIAGVKWLGDTDDFLLEAETNVYWYRAGDGTTEQLDLWTPLQNIAVLSPARLLAVTTQNIIGNAPVDQLQGELVTLEPNLGSQVHILDYSLVGNQARLIISTEGFGLPEQVKRDAENSLLMLEGGKVYRLEFGE